MKTKDHLTIWRFLRNRLSVQGFEIWIYKNEEIENHIDKDMYLYLISTDFHSKQSVWELKKKLEIYMEKFFPLKCECKIEPKQSTFEDISEIGRKLSLTFEVIKKCKNSDWGVLGLARCSECKRYWTVTQDYYSFDVFYVRTKRVEAEVIINYDIWPFFYEYGKVPDQPLNDQIHVESHPLSKKTPEKGSLLSLLGWLFIFCLVVLNVKNFFSSF